MDMSPIEYDGFHMLPVPEQAGVVQFHYFQIDEKGLQGETIGRNDLGEAYYVMLLKQDENGVRIDDVFEAVFSDPLVYAKSLAGTNFFGTFVKKTDDAKVWFGQFLKGTMTNLFMANLKEAIANANNSTV